MGQTVFRPATVPHRLSIGLLVCIFYHHDSICMRRWWRAAVVCMHRESWPSSWPRFPHPVLPIIRHVQSPISPHPGIVLPVDVVVVAGCRCLCPLRWTGLCVCIPCRRCGCCVWGHCVCRKCGSLTSVIWCLVRIWSVRLYLCHLWCRYSAPVFFGHSVWFYVADWVSSRFGQNPQKFG